MKQIEKILLALWYIEPIEMPNHSFRTFQEPSALTIRRNCIARQYSNLGCPHRFTGFVQGWETFMLRQILSQIGFWGVHHVTVAPTGTKR
jgi:hypothetical protein